MKKGRPLAIDLVLGALAGAAATWAMDQATTAMYERESRQVRKKEDRARGGKTAYAVAASKVADAAGYELDEDEEKKAAATIHWALGIGAGAVYGALRNVAPRLGIGSGIAYGALFWLAMDEAALTLLGLTPPPKAFPWQTHVRGLAGHLVFGTIAEAFFDIADRAA